MADRVLVRHVRGGEKFVDAERVASLSPRWSVVEPQPEPPAPPEKKKRSAKQAEKSTPAVVPDNDSQEG